MLGIVRQDQLRPAVVVAAPVQLAPGAIEHPEVVLLIQDQDLGEPVAVQVRQAEPKDRVERLGEGHRRLRDILIGLPDVLPDRPIERQRRPRALGVQVGLAVRPVQHPEIQRHVVPGLDELPGLGLQHEGPEAAAPELAARAHRGEDLRHPVAVDVGRVQRNDVVRGQAGDGRAQRDAGPRQIVDVERLPVGDGQLQGAVPGELAHRHHLGLVGQLLRAQGDLVDPGRLPAGEAAAAPGTAARDRRQGPLHVGAGQRDRVPSDRGEDLHVPAHRLFVQAELGHEDRRDPERLPEGLEDLRIGELVGVGEPSAPPGRPAPAGRS